MTTSYPTHVYMGKSNKRNKKYMVVVGNKNIHFGTPRQLDFTKTHDTHDKRTYIHAHPGLSDISNIKLWYKPTFWERWILWNKGSKRESIRYLERKLHIRILPLIKDDAPHPQSTRALRAGASHKTPENLQRERLAIVGTATLGAATALALAHKQYTKNNAKAKAVAAQAAADAVAAAAEAKAKAKAEAEADADARTGNGKSTSVSEGSSIPARCGLLCRSFDCAALRSG